MHFISLPSSHRMPDNGYSGKWFYLRGKSVCHNVYKVIFGVVHRKPLFAPPMSRTSQTRYYLILGYTRYEDSYHGSPDVYSPDKFRYHSWRALWRYAPYPDNGNAIHRNIPFPEILKNSSSPTTSPIISSGIGRLWGVQAANKKRSTNKAPWISFIPVFILFYFNILKNTYFYLCNNKAPEWYSHYPGSSFKSHYLPENA